MKNIVYGYARVSRDLQNLERQLDALEKYGIHKLYQEKITGTRKNRPEFDKLLNELKNGDTIVIESLSRLGRSTKNLIQLMEEFNEKEINLVSLKENIDTKTATGKFMFTLLSAFSQMERDLIVERTNEGLASARARGRVGGRPPQDKLKIQSALKMYHSMEYSIREIEKTTGISKTTLYRYINKEKKEKGTI